MLGKEPYGLPGMSPIRETEKSFLPVSSRRANLISKDSDIAWVKSTAVYHRNRDGATWQKYS